VLEVDFVRELTVVDVRYRGAPRRDAELPSIAPRAA
jgi:hypothetical protein